MFFIDPLYIVLIVLTLVLSGAAQLFLSTTYGKWSKTPNSANLTGAQVGQRIIRGTSLARGTDKGDVRLERVPGMLTDHYDPSSHTVRMSDGVADRPSVAAMAIVAHELGHALQHQDRSVLIAMRSLLLPAVRFSPQISYFMILIGLIMNATGLIWLGIAFFAAMVVFSILTLPVEIDASVRGMRLLREVGLLESADDAKGSRMVLIAAASTYLAAAVTAVLQLLYYISLAQRR